MPGGVCQVLDYDTESMADYVSEMAVRILVPDMPVTKNFRKFVSQILTSTRLPSTTILLGMNYLAKRVNMLSAHGQFKAQEGQAWRMLTVALLLGSKFLDDNTFQNRSWSEVSGIPVAELNSMENDWLRQNSWGLYVNLDRSHDFNAWLKSWQEWQAIRQRQQLEAQQQQQKSQALARERLAPIVTSLGPEPTRRHHPSLYDGMTHEEIIEKEKHERRAKIAANLATKAGYRSREGSWQSQYPQSWQHSAPITPPDSGYGTPEYLNSAASCHPSYDDWFTQSMVSDKYQRGYQNHQPAYAPRNMSQYPVFGYNTWDPSANSHAPDCPCSNCMGMPIMHTKGMAYFPPQPFGRPVAG